MSIDSGFKGELGAKALYIGNDSYSQVAWKGYSSTVAAAMGRYTLSPPGGPPFFTQLTQVIREQQAQIGDYYLETLSINISVVSLLYNGKVLKCTGKK